MTTATHENAIQQSVGQNGAMVSSKKQKKVPETIQDYIKVMQPGIAKALPSVITPERFTRIVMTAVTNNPKLAQCSPESFVGAMMTAAQLGVEPNTPLGQAYLIPYGKQCQFQLGYKGLLDLAYRSGEISTIQAQVVYEHDEFSYAYGLEPTLVHVPARRERGDATHVYAVFRKKDGGFGFEVSSMEDILAHAKKYSKTFGSGPWQTNFEEMAKKTVLKQLLRYAPMKSDFARETATDGTVRTTVSPDLDGAC